MPQHGGKRPGAGRPKGSKNKSTIAREAVAEVLGVGDARTLEAAVHRRGHSLLLEMERIAHDPTQPLGARIMAARTALPFLLPRNSVDHDPEAAPHDIVARLEQGRRRVSEMRTKLVSG